MMIIGSMPKTLVGYNPERRKSHRFLLYPPINASVGKSYLVQSLENYERCGKCSGQFRLNPAVKLPILFCSASCASSKCKTVRDLVITIKDRDSSQLSPGERYPVGDLRSHRKKRRSQAIKQPALAETVTRDPVGDLLGCDHNPPCSFPHRRGAAGWDAKESPEATPPEAAPARWVVNCGGKEAIVFAKTSDEAYERGASLLASTYEREATLLASAPAVTRDHPVSDLVRWIVICEGKEVIVYAKTSEEADIKAAFLLASTYERGASLPVSAVSAYKEGATLLVSTPGAPTTPATSSLTFADNSGTISHGEANATEGECLTSSSAKVEAD